MKTKTCLTCGKEFEVVLDHASVSFCSYECGKQHAEDFTRMFSLVKQPQDIFEYKLKWMPGVKIPIHSDLTSECKDWCKENLKKWEWSISTWTDVYEHTLHFELQEYAHLFLEFYNERRK